MTQKLSVTESNCESEMNSTFELDEQSSDSLGNRLLDEPITLAFSRLQEILAAKKSMENELEDLFERRRAHALEELEKAKRRLEFVNQDERQMKELVSAECFRDTNVRLNYDIGSIAHYCLAGPATQPLERRNARQVVCFRPSSNSRSRLRVYSTISPQCHLFTSRNAESHWRLRPYSGWDAFSKRV